MNAAMMLLIAATLAAAAVDVKSRRIPNLLTGALAFAGIASHIPEGLIATLLAIAAMLIVFLIGSFAFSAGWFGGGDVKLISACCGLAGFPGSVPLVLEILIAGALLALVSAALRGELMTLVRSTLDVARSGAQGRKTAGLPYGVAIAAGSITYALSTLVPALRFSL